VCELAMVSHGKPCITNVNDGDITHCLRTHVQRLHGDYGLALIHLSLRGNSSHIVAVCLLIPLITCILSSTILSIMYFVKGHT